MVLRRAVRRGTERTDGMDTEPLTCLEQGADCRGPVEHRMLPDNPRAFPRCEHHFELRLAKSEANLELMSATPAPWFDESYAGERWDEDY